MQNVITKALFTSRGNPSSITLSPDEITRLLEIAVEQAQIKAAKRA